MSSDGRPSPGIAFVAAAAALWALIGLFTPALLELGVTAVEIAFWRALLGGLCFAVHGLLRRQLRVASTGDAGGLAVFGAVSVGLFYVALIKAIELGGISLAWILLYTAPGWVAVGAVVILREHVDRLRGALVAVTIAGVTLVAVGGGSGVKISAASMGWGLTAGLSYASWYIAGKRMLGRYAPVTISTWTLLSGAAVLAPLVGWPGYPIRAWLLLAGLAAVSTYLPVLAYYTGLQRVAAARAAIVATIEPVGALVIGAAIGAERLTVVAAMGALLVLVAAAVASTRPGTARAPQP